MLSNDKQTRPPSEEGVSCQRCKSPNHLVRDCLFRAKTALEENQGAKKLSSRRRPDSSQPTYAWKYEWFTSNGKEGCNLFQRNSCHQGTECKRAHVCKACTLWPIVNTLPDINSPFNIDTWTDCLSRPGGYSQKNLVGVCGPLPKTLTLFMTKICDFPYPIYDRTKNFIPYL